MTSKRILLVDTYYPEFLQGIYTKQPGLKDQSYQQQLDYLRGCHFGTSDYYSRHLNALGWQADDLIANNVWLQTQWAKEHQLNIWPLIPNKLRLYQVLLQQVKTFQPDILYMQNLGFCDPVFLRLLKKHTKLLVGQIACPLPPKIFLKPYDLILTSFPHFVPMIRALGPASEYFKIGFEASLVDQLKNITEKIYDVIFIGGFTKVHTAATQALERLAQQVRLDVWGYGIEHLAANSPLRQHYHGQAWGMEMYRVIKQAKICINRHSSAAQQFANNMRLYETTGMGTLLITDQKDNLSELFLVGQEIVTYTSNQDLIDQVRYYLAHDNEREQIAQAGQRRTLREHTYRQRMQELNTILQRY